MSLAGAIPGLCQHLAKDPAKGRAVPPDVFRMLANAVWQVAEAYVPGALEYLAEHHPERRAMLRQHWVDVDRLALLGDGEALRGALGRTIEAHKRAFGLAKRGFESSRSGGLF